MICTRMYRTYVRHGSATVRMIRTVGDIIPYCTAVRYRYRSTVPVRYCSTGTIFSLTIRTPGAGYGLPTTCILVSATMTAGSDPRHQTGPKDVPEDSVGPVFVYVGLG